MCTTGTLQTNNTCKSTQAPTCQTSGDTYSAGNCVRTKTTSSCPTGYTEIVSTYNTSNPTCPYVGTMWIANGKCTTYYLSGCPIGYFGEGPVDNRICTATVTCASGTFDTTTNLCKTPTGYVCKNTQICTTATCLEGTFDTTYGVCKGSAPTCPTEGIYSYPMSNGLCWASVLDVIRAGRGNYTTCDSGWTYDSTVRRCKAAPTCPAGTSIDPVSNLCVYPYASCSQGKVQCTGGQYYDSINKVCIYGKTSCPTASYTLSGTTCTLST
jgi:hypothetical protein